MAKLTKEAINEMLDKALHVRHLSDIKMEIERRVHIGACEIYEDWIMDESPEAIAYYTARLLQDDIRDPQTNNKKGARL